MVLYIFETTDSLYCTLLKPILHHFQSNITMLVWSTEKAVYGIALDIKEMEL